MQTATEGKQLTRKAQLLLAAAIGGFFITVFFNMFLAKHLGTHDYGDFKVAEAFFNLGGMVAMMGGAGAAIRFLRDHMAQSRQDAVWEYVRTYGIIILCVSAFMVVILGGAAFVHFHYLREEFHPLLIISISIPFASLTLLMSGVLQTAKRPDLAFLPWMLGFPILQFAFCVGLDRYFSLLTELTAIFATLAAAVSIALIQLIMLLKLGIMRIKRAPEVRQTRAWLAVSLPMMVISSMQIGMNQVDIYMLEILGEEMQVGHFAAATTTVNFYYLLRMAVSRAIAPYMLDAWYSGQSSTCILNRRGFHQLTFFSTVLAVICVVLGEEILSLYGGDHRNAFWSLMILLLGYVPFTALGLSSDWLKYVGHERFVMIMLASSILVNMLLNMFLIPLYGMEGAAMATAISMWFYICLLTLRQKQIMGIYPWTSCLRLDVEEADSTVR